MLRKKNCLPSHCESEVGVHGTCTAVSGHALQAVPTVTKTLQITRIYYVVIKNQKDLKVFLFDKSLFSCLFFFTLDTKKPFDFRILLKPL